MADEFGPALLASCAFVSHITLADRVLPHVEDWLPATRTRKVCRHADTGTQGMYPAATKSRPKRPKFALVAPRQMRGRPTGGWHWPRTHATPTPSAAGAHARVARQALVRVGVVAHLPFVDDPIAGDSGPSAEQGGWQRPPTDSFRRDGCTPRLGPAQTVGTSLTSAKNAQQLPSTQ
jgi:hypothetical protein